MNFEVFQGPNLFNLLEAFAKRRPVSLQWRHCDNTLNTDTLQAYMSFSVNKIEAPGPENPGNGYQARRLTLSVIRNDDGSPREFVVQRQCIDENGKATFQDGNWMPVFSNDPKKVQAEAWARFKERADEDTHYPLADLDSDRFFAFREALTVQTGKG